MAALQNSVDFSRSTILLVDDDQQARNALRGVLESQGLECIEVSNGSEALDWLKTQKPDLIISDNQMPGLSGLDFIEKFQPPSKEQSPPPIILLSGNLNPQDKTRAREAGVFAILDKPCNFSEFLSMVQLALDQ